MSVPRTCAKCGRVTFERRGRLLKMGWSERLIAGEYQFECPFCTRDRHAGDDPAWYWYPERKLRKDLKLKTETS